MQTVDARSEGGPLAAAWNRIPATATGNAIPPARPSQDLSWTPYDSE